MSLLPKFIFKNLKKNRNIYLIYIKFNSIIFVDTLIIISNRIYKQTKSSSIFKRALLSKVIVRSKEISIYENCFKYGLRFYTVSPLDSIQYVKCVRSNCSGYDILDLITTQLETLSSTHIRLETKLENTFEK